VNCAVLCVKDDWKGQFWGLRYCLSKLRSLLSLPSGIMSHSKIAQFNWESKGKVIPLQVRCGPEGGYRYSSTLPWPPIALFFHDRSTRRGWVVRSTPRPHFTPGKDPVPILQEAGWAPGPVWTGAEKNWECIVPLKYDTTFQNQTSLFCKWLHIPHS